MSSSSQIDVKMTFVLLCGDSFDKVAWDSQDVGYGKIGKSAERLRGQ